MPELTFQNMSFKTLSRGEKNQSLCKAYLKIIKYNEIVNIYGEMGKKSQKELCDIYNAHNFTSKNKNIKPQIEQGVIL